MEEISMIGPDNNTFGRGDRGYTAWQDCEKPRSIGSRNQSTREIKIEKNHDWKEPISIGAKKDATRQEWCHQEKGGYGGRVYEIGESNQGDNLLMEGTLNS